MVAFTHRISAQNSDSILQRIHTYKKAELFFQQENYKEAEPLFLNLTKYDSFANPSWFRIACIFKNQKQFNNALASIQNIKNIDSQEQYLLFKAALLKEMGQKLEAGNCFEKSIAFHPNYWSRYKDAADCYAHTPDKKYLLDLCRKWERQFQIRPEIATFYFYVFYARKQTDSIINLSERLVLKYPTNSKIIKQHIEICNEFNRQDQLKSFLSRFPNSESIVNFNTVSLLYASYNNYQIKNPFKKSIWYQQHRSEILNILQNNQNYSIETSAFFDLAIESEKKIDTFRLIYSWFSKNANQDPQKNSIQETFALRLFQQGDIKNALPLLELATQNYSPKIDGVYKALVMSYLWLKDSASMNIKLNSLSELFPFLPVTQYKRITHCLLQNDTLCLNAICKDQELNSTTDQVLITLKGLAEFQLNLFENCIKTWNRLKPEQENALLFEKLAFACEKTNRYPEALNYYNKSYLLGLITKTVYNQKEILLQK